jgi:hypothetical protein
MGRPFRCARRRPRIHKPSRAVSFGLPDRLSICARGHAMVTADRGKLRQGKRQGQAANRPDPPSSGECNGCEDGASKGKAQEIKGEPDAGLCGIDGIGGHAKPDQYGRCIRHLGDGAARALLRVFEKRSPWHGILRGSTTMTEIVTMLFASLSVTVFLAHAYDAYRGG